MDAHDFKRRERETLEAAHDALCRAVGQMPGGPWLRRLYDWAVELDLELYGPEGQSARVRVDAEELTR